MRIMQPCREDRAHPVSAPMLDETCSDVVEKLAYDWRVAVTQTQKRDPILNQAERLDRRMRLCHSQSGESFSRKLAGSRMRTAAVREHHNVYVSTLGLTFRNQTATTQTFIVGVWCEHQNRLLTYQRPQIYDRQIAQGLKDCAGSHHGSQVGSNSTVDAPPDLRADYGGPG
jgi:hypothetical protein